MIFTLGFLSAGLAALAFAPAFWRRANRLTRRRLEMQIPLSVQEILAERDQLRAEFAVERHRLGQRADQLIERHAVDLAELGRRMTELTVLKADLAMNSTALRDGEQARAQMEEEWLAAQAELGALNKALYDSEGLLERKQAEAVEHVRLQETMKRLAETRLAALAASDARVASLELRLGDVSRHLLEAERKLTEKDLHARGLADVVSIMRHELDVAENRIAKLQERLEAEARRATQLTDELAALHQEHDANLGRLRNLMVKTSVGEAALEDARRRETHILAQRDQQAERAREVERALSERNVQLRSEYAALQGALDVARQRCEELEGVFALQRAAASNRQNGAVATDADDKAFLRQSISEIGAAIIRMARANGDGAPEPHALGLPRASMPALVKIEAAETRPAGHERVP